jgi:hypothetical protein
MRSQNQGSTAWANARETSYHIDAAAGAFAHPRFDNRSITSSSGIGAPFILPVDGVALHHTRVSNPGPVSAPFFNKR